MTTVVVQRAALATAARHAAELTHPDPRFPAAFLTFRNGAAAVSAIGPEACLQHRIEIDPPVAPLDFAVDAQLLDRVLGKLPGDQVEIRLAADAVTFGQDRVRFDLERIVHDVEPTIIMDLPSVAHAELPADPLTDLLGRVQHVTPAEPDTVRYYLNGVHLRIARSHDAGIPPAARATFTATDGHRLCRDRTTVTVLDGDFPDDGILVPTRTIALLRAVMRDTHAPLAVDAHAGQATFRTGAVTVQSRLIAGTYPETDRIFPPAPRVSVRFDHASLQQTTDRVATVLARSREPLQLAITNDGTEISATGGPLGASATETVPHEGSLSTVIGINPRYLLHALAVLPGGTIELSTGSRPTSAVLIRHDELPDLDVLIMPMRLGASAA